MDDATLRQRLTEALMKHWGCTRTDEWGDVPYCEPHGSGWLHDVDACVKADTAATALMPVVREALAEVWDDLCEMRDPEKRDNPWRES